MLDKLRKTVLIKRPILFDLDNTVSGRAPIEKKNQQKKKYTVGLRSETFLLTFATRNVSEKNVVTYENWSEGDLLHVRVELEYLLVTLSLKLVTRVVKNFETIY